MSQPDRRPRDQNRGSFGRGRGGGRGRGRGRGRAGTQNPRNLDPQPEKDEAQPQKGNVARGRGNKAERGRGAGKHRYRNVGTVQGRRQEDRRSGKILSKGEIKNLASGQSSEVIRCIIDNEGGFLATFNHPLSCGQPHETLRHLIKVLYLLVKSEDGHLASRIIAEIMGASSGASAFLNNLGIMIMMMPTERHDHVKRENPQFLHYIYEIGLFAISTVPRSVMYTFPYLPLKDTVQRLLTAQGDPLLTQALKLVDEYTAAHIPQEEPPNDPSVGDAPDNPPAPPENFTELPVLPSSEEMHPYAVEPFLRPNITNGSYTDWEHYLDVQFRLMREDFVAPLRDGITHFEHAAKYPSEV